MLGRLASVVAMRLRGKHKPSFTPHMDMGDNVVVVNADKVTPDRAQARGDKTYYRHTGYPGGIKSRTARQVLEGDHPERVVEAAVRRMMPGGPLTRKQIRNLRVYAGAEHPHEAQSARGARPRRRQRQERTERMMAAEIKTLEGLKDAVAGDAATAPAAAQAEPESVTETAPVYEAKRDELGRSYATGKRKDAIARVWVKPGKGTITVNGREVEKYFARPVLRMVINQPFQIVNVSGQFDVVCTVKGGGLSGQAGAVKHGISKALALYDPEFRPALKKSGFLTRDPRVVERKKYGKAKARRSFQFSKR